MKNSGPQKLEGTTVRRLMLCCESISDSSVLSNKMGICPKISFRVNKSLTFATKMSVIILSVPTRMKKYPKAALDKLMKRKIILIRSLISHLDSVIEYFVFEVI